MAQFQLIGCHLNIGGDRGSVVVYNRFNPITFPEYLMLQVVHGGEEHVHHAMSVGYVEMPSEVLYDQLCFKYGDPMVATVFPGPLKQLPLGNEAMLTEEEWEAGEKAMNQARSSVRKSRKAPKMDLPADADQVAAGP